MRDAAGQLADRLHLLRLPQLLLELAALGDVPRVDDNRADRRIAEAIDGDPFHDPPVAVRVLEAHFLADRAERVAERLGQLGAHHVAIVRMDVSRRSTGRTICVDGHPRCRSDDGVR